MAIVRHEVSEHDVVVLCEPVGDWPAVTRGTAISVYDGSALVEISDSHGRTLDMVQVPAALLEIKRR
jgi:hypothetical protein